MIESTTRALVVGIGGVSSSGKTTLSRLLPGRKKESLSVFFTHVLSGIILSNKTF
jgi:uridine kinase